MNYVRILIFLFFKLIFVQAKSKGYLRLQNQKINTFIGTEKQLVLVNIDTTKSDLMLFRNKSACNWIGDSSNIAFLNFYQICNSQASFFDVNASSSFIFNDTTYPFSYSYNNLTGYGHAWGYDTFEIGNKTIKNMQIAILNQSTNIYGILGVGLPQKEFTTQSSDFTYSNFPFRLKQQGIINKAMYSINPLPFSFLEFLFGAINEAKYEGSLEVFNLVDNEILFDCESIYVNDEQIASSVESTYIDNNSFELSFPGDLFQNVMSALNASESSTFPGYYQTSATNGTLSLKFNETIIPVNFSQIIDGDGIVSITESEEHIILGRPFLSGAFIVVDLEDEILAIGKAKIPNTKDKIKVVGSQKNSTLEIISKSNGSKAELNRALFIFSLSLLLIF